MDMTTCSRSRYLQSLVLKPSLNTTLPVPFANTFTPRLTTMRWGTPRGANINYAVYGGLFLESSKSYKRDPLPPKCICAVMLCMSIARYSYQTLGWLLAMYVQTEVET